MSRPRLLDLFCCAGGAAMGYHRAGFEVVGVDREPQPHYPFEFVRADAINVLKALAVNYEPWPHAPRFDAIHASPPCQDHIRGGSRQNHGTGWMLAESRKLLTQTGLPWVIENVPGAPMRADYKLCGCMFDGLQVRRERWFETSWHGFAMNLGHDHSQPALSVVGNGTPSGVLAKGIVQTVATCRVAMGIPWMTRAELSQAIPPAYTELVGTEMLAYMTSEGAA